MNASPPTNHTNEVALRRDGYRPLTLRWGAPAHVHPKHGQCADFDVEGEVASSGGTYLFTLDRGPTVEVRYVGMTGHLWMVTLGRLPNGGARGGQRYGRPRHSGATRQRVNAALAADVANGDKVRMWFRPLPGSRVELKSAEEADITRWDLRRLGLNIR